MTKCVLLGRLDLVVVGYQALIMGFLLSIMVLSRGICSQSICRMDNASMSTNVPAAPINLTFGDPYEFLMGLLLTAHLLQCLLMLSNY